MQNNSANSASSRCGATVVELAFVFPILLLLLFGAIDFSRANSIRNTAENAAYEGARRAIVPGATSQSAEEAANAILGFLSLNSTNVTVAPTIITNSTPQVTVSVSVPLAGNLYAANQLLTSKTITRSCTLTREQFTVVAP